MKSAVSNLKSKNRGAVLFVPDFQHFFLGRQAKEDAPRQKPIEPHIQRDGGHGLNCTVNLRQDSLMV